MNNKLTLLEACLCALAGQFAFIGILFITLPWFNLFVIIDKTASWIGIPLLILAGLIFQKSVQKK